MAGRANEIQAANLTRQGYVTRRLGIIPSRRGVYGIPGSNHPILLAGVSQRTPRIQPAAGRPIERITPELRSRSRIDPYAGKIADSIEGTSPESHPALIETPGFVRLVDQADPTTRALVVEAFPDIAHSLIPRSLKDMRRNDPLAQELYSFLLDMNQDLPSKRMFLQLPVPGLLELYSTGNRLLDIRGVNNLRALELLSSGRLAEINRRLGRPSEYADHNAGDIITYALDVLSVIELNAMARGPLQVQENIVEQMAKLNMMPADFMKAMLNLTKEAVHDARTVGKIERAVVRTAVAERETETETAAHREEAVQALKEAIASSKMNTPSEIKKCEIASEALAALGEQGFEALLDIHSGARASSTKNLIHRALLKFNYGLGSVAVRESIKGRLVALILNSGNGAPLAIRYLRALGLAGQVSEATDDLVRMYRTVVQSSDPMAAEITGKSREFIRAVSGETDVKLVETLRIKDKEHAMLIGLVKAILLYHGLELSERGLYEEAEDVLLTAASPLGVAGYTTAELHYALAYNYFGLGRDAAGREQLRKAVELDSSSMTQMLMTMERISLIDDGEGFMDLARHTEKAGMNDKATVLYAMGYIILNKKSFSPARAAELVNILMADENRSLWGALQRMLRNGDKNSFERVIKGLINRIKTEEPRVIGTIREVETPFDMLAQQAINEAKSILGLD